MRKIYFASALFLVFLGALAIDWNASQSTTHQEGAASMIRSRDDDILELEIGYPQGEAPPSIKVKKPEFRTLPPESGRKTVKVLEEKPPKKEPAKTPKKSLDYYYHVVKEGETISGISYKYLHKDRVKQIMELNNIRDAKLIRPNDTLKIPKGVTGFNKLRSP